MNSEQYIWKSVEPEKWVCMNYEGEKNDKIKADIILLQIIKSNTGIVIADSTTGVDRIYAETCGKIR